MLKKEHLFFLIKSMTKAEKRYFKLFVSTNNENCNYLLLFDAIDKQSVYDEYFIKQKFAGKKFISQLHVTKNYLNQLILKSLRNFHTAQTKESELKDLQRDIEILYKRELYPQCMQLIEKAISIAKQYEKWPDLLNLLDIKRRLQINLKGSGQSLHEMKSLISYEKEILKKIENTAAYWELTQTMFSTSGSPQKILDNELLSGSNMAQSIQAKTLFYYIHHGVLFTKNKLAEAISVLEEAIELWEKNPHYIKEHPASYLTLHNNLAGVALQVKKYSYVEKVLQKIRHIPEQYGISKNNPIAIKAILHSYNVEMEMYRDCKQLDKGITTIQNIEYILNDKSLAIAKTFYVLFYYQFAYLYYLNDQYSKSLDYLNLILSGKYFDLRQDIEAFAHLLFLIIHFELRNMILLRYAVESCRRFLKKKRNLHTYEKTLLAGFSKLSTVPQTQFKNVFVMLKEELFSKISPREKDNVLDYLNFEDWINKNLNTLS
jgi:hypothetical protein